MSLVRVIARPLLAAMFVTGGIDAALKPDPKAALAEGVATPIARSLPLPLPEDPAQLVRINGIVQVAAGLMLATGRLPRLAALTLAASLVPTTLAGHRFWEQKDKAARKTQQIQFFKNLSLLGGLLLAVADTGGRPSLAHLGRDAVRDSLHATHEASHKARHLLPTG